MKNKELILEIQKDVQAMLSKERYKHSLGVMKRAEKLATIYNENIEIAKMVGLAHDIAKEMPKEEKLKYINKNKIDIDEIEKENVGLLHGKIGADICKKRYNFSIKMQKAIIYHTTGNPDMDNLAKIIYLADKTEENRKQENYDVEKIRKLSDEDINKAMLEMLEESINFNIKKRRLIHPDSILTRNCILLEYNRTEKA